MKKKVTELAEGQEYEFDVVKMLEIGHGEYSYVLNGPGNRRFLLPVERYANYGIEPGRSVVCRVDKINCKGEVFLEPKNPWYVENSRYGFEVVEYRTMAGGAIRRGKVMMVRSITGDIIPVSVPAGSQLPEPGENIELIVIRISKGRLHLAVDRGKSGSDHLDPDVDYDFEVTGSEIDLDGEEYFIATDQLGVGHAIKKRYYEYYGLREGVRFRGRVVRYREDGSKLIEPENPFYSIGQLIEIEIVRKERNRSDGSYYIAGTDRFGQSHEMRLRSGVDGDSLTARVVMIRKGKPLLELVKEA
jgi:hypothetical protein